MSNKKESTRSKLNSYFNGSNGGSKKNQKSRDLEDPVDIYSHTHQFFKKDGKEYENDKVDIGERRIKGDIDQAFQMSELD